MTIWDCRTHVPMTSSVERTDLDFKISVALLWSQLANLDQILCVASLGVGERLHKVLEQIGSSGERSLPFGLLVFLAHLSWRLIWWAYRIGRPPSSSVVRRRRPHSWNLVCIIGCSSTTKFAQMMTLGWPWPILRQGQIWSLMLLYGKQVKQWIFQKLL